jgi:hypothetical protein
MSLRKQLYEELAALEDANERLRVAMGSAEQELVETRLGRDQALQRESDANAHNTNLQRLLDTAREQRGDLRRQLVEASTTILNHQRDNERLTLEGKLLLDRIQTVHTLTCPDCWPEAVLFQNLAPTGYSTEHGEVQQVTEWQACDRHSSQVRQAEYQTRILAMPLTPPVPVEEPWIPCPRCAGMGLLHDDTACEELAGQAFRDAAAAEGMPQP